MNIFKEAFKPIFPCNCASCGVNLVDNEEVICSVCLHELPTTDHFKHLDNETARVFWGRVPLQFAVSYLNFRKFGRVQQLMHLFKYDDKPIVGEALAKHAGLLWKPFLDKFSDKPTVVIPVPLHPKKKHIRGYNQSDYIAYGLQEALEIDCSVNLLQKNIHTESQTKKGRFSRWQNVSDKFILHKPDKHTGAHFLLVDDVITTGSTLEACAKTLLQIPGSRVSVFTLARA
ncbi:MAG: ComF family protein [Luteibaculaceae bacterium]